MKKLFVFQYNQDVYRDELECAYEKVVDNKAKLDLSLLTVDYLIDKGIEIVITNCLPREWYFTLRGLNIVTITFGDRGRFSDYSDIVIDCLSDDDKRYFTGKNYSVRQNGNLEIGEIVNLIQKLEWDSNYFGFNIAYLSCMHLTENIMHRIEKFIRREDIRLVEYLCNCHDRRSVRVAEKNGFQFVDIRLTYKKILHEKESISLDKWTFNRATENDIPTLRKMVSNEFYKDSRYFFDDNFDVEKIDEFYQDWVKKGVLGQYDDECWCLYDNKVPVAFCTFRYENQKNANIGIFGIDRKNQGRRLGEKLLCSVLNMLIDRNIRTISVVTQGRNYYAQCLYQGVGFRTESTQLWYHKWI